MRIEINALDTLFFRDGKPFSMGEETWASGVFPPPPSVFYGAIRTAYISQNNLPLNEGIKQTEKLVIKSIFLKSNEGILYPIPADVIDFNTEKNGDVKKTNIPTKLELSKINFVSSLSEFQYFFKTHENETRKVKEIFGKSFLTVASMNRYIKGEKEIPSYKNLSDLITSEPKIGNKRNKETLISDEESELYRVGMYRLKNDNNELNFIIEFENLDLVENGFLKLGGEGKVAKYKILKDKIIEVEKVSIVNDKIKLVLLTPTIYNNQQNAAIPEWMQKGILNNVKFQLLTYSVGKPIFQGGFDIEKRKPKPMKKSVPAGSVYVLQCNEMDLLINELNKLDTLSELNQKEGFGKFLISNL